MGRKIAAEVRHSQERIASEQLVAGAAAFFGARGDSAYVLGLADICPPSLFVSLQSKELFTACIQIVEAGGQIDLPALNTRLRANKAVSSAVEAGEMMHAAGKATTRGGGEEAARYVVELHNKQLLVEKLQAAQAALQKEQINPIELADLAEAIRGISEPAGQLESRKNPLDIDTASVSALRFLNEYPPAFDWLLQGSLIKGDFGLIVGAPGVGKSTFALHLAAALAAGKPVLESWLPVAAARCAYISAEDSEAVLQRRTYHILHSMGLTAEELQGTAERMFVSSTVGDVALLQDGKPTPALRYLRASMRRLGAQLYILDNLARFAASDENDNASMTRFCAELESLCKEFSCNIILLHHTNKTAGDCLSDPKSLDAALNQTGIRGASAISGCARWVLSMASLSSELASKTFGSPAHGRYSGSYLAVRVSKKNAGAPESRHYFERGEHGLLEKVVPSKSTKEATDEDELSKIIIEVERRQKAGEQPLSKITGVATLLSCSRDKARRLSEISVQNGLLETVQLSSRGGGEGLCTMGF